ncbi:MarR family transcriptional regulator [Devosia sp. FJ2-5-3]|uniref:MarR family winged helix-turn-helix transcriptional regulator n=1 Tax=Devosia sp. FJ2-5-3 TaxID=2976680 RepID=UPI0023D87A60|nr:MarR family transcriptional regulator [Devosia sp. FJ2-5-3]WEJ56755.1 MarR family transcriptional regulator [Devosia sp. FJ2-5-3]
MSKPLKYVSTYTPRGAFAETMLVTARLYRLELEKVFKPSGLTLAMLEPLFRLERSKTVMQQTLVRSLRVSAASVVPQLDRLVALGFVERSQDTHDRRENVLAITELGASVAHRCREMIAEVSEKYFADIEERAFSDGNYILAALLKNLEREKVQAYEEDVKTRCRRRSTRRQLPRLS